MMISRFEAIVLAAFSEEKVSIDTTFPAYCLVLDLDHCTSGLCLCAESGKTELVSSIPVSGDSIDIDEVIEEIAGKKSSKQLDAVRASKKSFLTTLNQTMKSYFTSKRMNDNAALVFEGVKVSCSEVEKRSEDARKKVISLLKKSDAMIEEANADVLELKIIIIGNAAEFYPLEYCVREHFSVSPLLPDSRFLDPAGRSSPEELISLGQSLFEKANTLGYSVELVLLERGGEAGRSAGIVMATADRAKSELTVPEFFGPVLVSGNDKFLLNIGENKAEVALPCVLLPAECDLFDAGIKIIHDNLIICLRRSRAPEEQYEVRVVL